MVEIIKADLLDTTKGIICHQVNSQGKMGTGIAKQIRIKYPQVYDDYIQVYQTSGLKLCSSIITQIDKELYIASLVGQKYFGRNKNYVYTNYDALKIALHKTSNYAKDLNLKLYIPFNMGCGLANGNWDKVFEIINNYAPNSIVCRL